MVLQLGAWSSRRRPAFHTDNIYRSSCETDTFSGMHSLRRHFFTLESWSPPLVRMALVSTVLLLVALIGLAVDTRVITGAPAWLKPAKFGLSVAVYLLSLAWMVRDLPRTPTLRRATSTIAWIITAEVLLICVQAARGTTSHFNVNTPIDSAIFSAMGLGIATVWIASAVILWQHWRAPSRDTSMAMAMRIGLTRNDAIERTVLVVATSACSIAFVTALMQALRGLPLLPLTGSS